MSNAIIIMGPTAVGKSEIAVRVAEKVGGEIVSADSMQIYRGLEIGVAKPSRELLSRAPHHMIGVADPAGGYSVFEYREAAGRVIEDIRARGGTPVIAGGTGLYIHSLVFDMDFGGSRGDERAREKYERLAEERGREYVYGLLAERDPEAAKLIHPNNLTRVVRALERLSAETGDEQPVPPSDGEGVYRPFGFDLQMSGLIDPAMFLLTRDRAELVRRREDRVDEMIRSGLEREAKQLMELDLPPDRITALGIGYKEMIGYLRGEYDLAEAADQIKTRTRRYARRQMTWFKRYKNAKTIDLSKMSEREAVASLS
jgi:tRNA dimethylallyltransferase